MELTKKQGEAEHDKLKYSLFRKANNAALQSVYDANTRKAQVFQDIN
jgi:hypothetical protein